MNLLAVIGGVSWTGTAEYYRLLNEGAASRLGALHSARLLRGPSGRRA
jgi:aspartate racemase